MVAFDVVWVDGALVHELLVLGSPRKVRQADVVTAAAAIHDRSAGAALR